MRTKTIALAALLATTAISAQAANLWIDDTSGNIGLVNTTTGALVPGTLHNTGQILTDIAFGTDGVMYGTTFNNLFSINITNGAATAIGPANGNGGMNALVGSGTAGNLLGASNNTTTVFNISQTTGLLTTFGTSTLTSAGDLAFVGATLYESAVNGAADALVDVTHHTTIGNFHTAGISSFSGVFGLADDGTTLFAVNGTQIYTVDPATALMTLDGNFNGTGLGAANGTAFINEGSTGVPEPATLGVLGLGFAGLLLARRRR